MLQVISHTINKEVLDLHIFVHDRSFVLLVLVTSLKLVITILMSSAKKFDNRLKESAEMQQRTKIQKYVDTTFYFTSRAQC